MLRWCQIVCPLFCHIERSHFLSFANLKIWTTCALRVWGFKINNAFQLRYHHGHSHFSLKFGPGRQPDFNLIPWGLTFAQDFFQAVLSYVNIMLDMSRVKHSAGPGNRGLDDLWSLLWSDPSLVKLLVPVVQLGCPHVPSIFTSLAGDPHRMYGLQPEHSQGA